MSIKDLFTNYHRFRVLTLEQWNDLKTYFAKNPQWVTEVRDDKEVFKITFFFYTTKELPPKEIWNSLIKFATHEDFKEIIEIEISGLRKTEAPLKNLISIFLTEKISTKLIPEDKSIEFTPKTEEEKEKLDQIHRYLKNLFRFVFKEEWNFHIKDLEHKSEPLRRRESQSDSVTTLTLFDKEERVDERGTKKYKIGITDWQSQYYWLALSSKEIGDIDKKYESLEIGKQYECAFSFTSSSDYQKVIDGFVNSIKKSSQEIKTDPTDNSEKKLYSFCVHTKNSAFDGLFTAEEFVHEAKRRGHEFIGVADIDSVQSFSLLEKHANKEGIKPIYGVELRLIPKSFEVTYGDLSKWNKKEYCVFDIETTGLNPLFDELLQISIHKFDMNNELKGKFQTFIFTDKVIPENIVELTGISQQKINEEGSDLKKTLKEIREFVDGCLLVAHNGISFDLPFLNAKYRQNGFENLDVPLLDTMKLSQILFLDKKYKSHTLSALCKRAGVFYDEEKAHDADVDVSYLDEAFQQYLLKNLYERGYVLDKDIERLSSELFNEDVYNYVYGSNILLYVKNQTGVRNLYELVSIAHTDLYYSRANLTKEVINNLREGIVVVSAPIFSDLVEFVLKDDEEGFVEAVKFYDYVILPPPSHFEHEIEKQMLLEGDEKKIIEKLYSWCIKHNKTYLINGAVRYIELRDHESYKVLVNTKGLAGRRHYLFNSKKENAEIPAFNYRNTQELINEFQYLNKANLLDEAYDNQSKFLSEIGDNLEVIKKKLHPPVIENSVKLFKDECIKNMKRIYGKKPHKYILDKFEQESKSICDNNFTVIYWVSHLLVKKSIESGYLVGSRGSVGSSFAAFLLRISEVNPLPPHYFCTECSHFELESDFVESGFDLPPKECPHCNKRMNSDGHNIPFETFMGFGGNKVPDIDLNFSGEYQIKAHQFLKDFFGEKQIFRAGTISAMADKTAFAVVSDYLEATKQKKTQGKYRWLTSRIVNVKRTSGQHPGGILVVPEDKSIYDFTPVNYPANDITGSWKTTHFEFDDLHDALLKFDILGHDDPTTLALLKKLTGFDPMDVPRNDPQLLKLYRSCEVMNIKQSDLVNNDGTGAIGLPEFGTLLTRKIIQACQPQTFADLIRISGFSHGTGVWKKNIDALIKEEKKPLNQVITCRDDIMIYLMSMNLSREDAFNITEDIRKGRGISKENLKKLTDANVPDWYIESAKKISYIFPKAHATAYVLMSWKIAYYKLYYPLAFYSVYFSIACENFDIDTLLKNDVELIKEKYGILFRKWKSPGGIKNLKAKEKALLTIYEVSLEFLARNFEFKNIDINKSKYNEFVPIPYNEQEKAERNGKAGALLLPFIVVDGLGEIKAKSIEEEREKGGEYKNLEDLLERTSLNKTVIESFKKKEILPVEWLA